MSVVTLTRSEAETFAGAVRLVQAAGWSWSVDGGPGNRLPEAYVHIPESYGVARRCINAEGRTPELALIAAYRRAAAAALSPTATEAHGGA